MSFITKDIYKTDEPKTVSPKSYYLSAPVGSGKTQAVVEEISSSPNQNYIYVTPTRDLAAEIHERLRIAMSDKSTSHTIQMIVDENRRYAPTVKSRTLSAISNRSHNQNHTLVITTENLKALLPEIHEYTKSEYHVFVDEGIDALEMVEFNTAHTDIYMGQIDVGPNGEFTSKGSAKQLLEYAANNPKRLSSIGREEFSGPAIRRLSYLVTSELYDVFGQATEKSIKAIGFLSPLPFHHFKSVTLVMANFEQSLIALFWSRKYGLDFLPYSKQTTLFDTHSVKGSSLSIYYALHPSDSPSRMNLERNWQTGGANEDAFSGERAIDRIAQVLGEKFAGSNYCWAANQYYTNEKGWLNNYRMPIKCAGLDEFKSFDIIFSLACMNPPPWVKSLITKYVAIDDNELYARWRFEDTYQTVGRCSLRDRNSDRHITIVVLSRECALQLRALFPDATIEGQITDLPSYAAMRKKRGPAKTKSPYLRKDHSAWHRYHNGPHYQGETKEEWFKRYRQAEAVSSKPAPA